MVNLLTLLFFTIALLFAGCQTADKQHVPVTSSPSLDSLREAKRWQRATIGVVNVLKQIRSGDLIVRRGNDFTSETLRQINLRNKDYSHCGLITIENDTPWVYHALGGEFNPNQKILRESIWQFCHPNGNKGFGLYRFDQPEALLQPAIEQAIRAFQAGITFDMNFDLSTDQQQYCAEFVWKCFNKVNALNNQFNLSHLGGKQFIGVDDLFLHPRCKAVTSATYP